MNAKNSIYLQGVTLVRRTVRLSSGPGVLMAINVFLYLLLPTLVTGGPALFQLEDTRTSRAMAPLFTISEEFVLSEGAGSATVAVCELSISTNLRRIDWAGVDCLQYSTLVR